MKKSLSAEQAGVVDAIFEQVSAFLDGSGENVISKIIPLCPTIDVTQPTAVLYGGGGRGKTFCVEKLVNRLERKAGIACHLVAPTHKAAGVLADSTSRDTATLHSFLGIRMAKDDETGKLASDYKNLDFSEHEHGTLLVVDECSMVGTDMFSAIMLWAEATKSFVLFMGDDAQLPPVDGKPIPIVFDMMTDVMSGGGFELSPVWDLPNRYILNECFRAKGTILELCDELREYIITDKGTARPDIKAHHDDATVFFYRSATDFENRMRYAAMHGLFNKVGREGAKAISYRNATVQSRSDVVRTTLGFRNMIEKGERIVTTKPLMKYERGCKPKVVIQNQTELIVTDIVPTTIRLDGGAGRDVDISGYCVKLNDSLDDFYIMHPDEKENIDSVCRTLRKEMRVYWNNGDKYSYRLWKSLVDRIEDETFVHWQYAYSETSHRSQGSTYGIVFVDASDIFSVKPTDTMTKYRSLYTSVSRAAKELHVKI